MSVVFFFNFRVSYNNGGIGRVSAGLRERGFKRINEKDDDPEEK